MSSTQQPFLAIPFPKVGVNVGQGWDWVVKAHLGGLGWFCLPLAPPGCPLHPCAACPRLMCSSVFSQVSSWELHSALGWWQHHSLSAKLAGAWLWGSRLGLVWHWSSLVHIGCFQTSSEWSQPLLMRIQKQINWWKQLFFPDHVCLTIYNLFPLFLAKHRVKSVMRALIIPSAIFFFALSGSGFICSSQLFLSELFPGGCWGTGSAWRKQQVWLSMLHAAL